MPGRRETNVQMAIAAVERVLPGKAAPEGARDKRWQAVLDLTVYIQSDPGALWPFVLKWGSHKDEDLRGAVATMLLEHLLEHHFDLIFPKVKTAARSNSNFAATFKICHKFGQSEEPARSMLFDQLKHSL